jgi:DNA-binding NtrC family response regulator
VIEATSAAEALSAIAVTPIDLVIADTAIPGVDGMDLLSKIRERSPRSLVIVGTGSPSIETAVETMKRGAYHYVGKPFRTDEMLFQVERALQRVWLEREVEDLRGRAGREADFHGIIAQSKRMRDVFEFVRKVATTDAPVMIRGESGTGKELVARAIHRESHRRAGEFLGINTAALPEQLLEAELFGYKKGAFTGAAADKEGLLTSARGGTVFLDEISGMPPACQAKLLRAIEEMEVLPVGGLSPQKIDARFVSATNSEKLEEMRQDLFYRLGVMEIRVPPLRERIEDVPLLATAFVERYARKFGRGPKRLNATALEMLMTHYWPGNVRELENVVQRAVVVSGGEEISAGDIHIGSYGGGEEAPAADCAIPYDQARQRTVITFQRRYVTALLKRAGGNISKAAAYAKVTRAALYAIMKRTGVRPGRRGGVR